MIRSRDRRRNLTEESVHDESTHDSAHEAREPVAYGEGVTAFADLRLRDLIPRRRRFVAAWFSVAVLTMAAIIGAHLGRAAIAEWFQLATVPGLDLNQPANLAAWFSSVAFGGAGLLATIVYGLRRFRLDDYAGHYRLWLFVVPSLFLASVCAIVPLHEVWSLVCARLIGGNATDATVQLWWAAPAILAVVGIGGRVFFEVKRNKFCLASGLLGIASLSACLLTKSGYLAIAGVETCLLIEGTLMLGAGSIALCCLLYARQMLLEIEGVLSPHVRKPKPRKSKRKVEAELAESESKPRTWLSAGKFWRRDKPAAANASTETAEEKPKAKPAPVAAKPSVPAPHFAAKPAPQKPAVNDDEDDDDTPASNVPRSKLSRAERKRLRRQEQDDD
jgi:hypothetical protein